MTSITTTLLRIAHQVRRLYWKIVRPVTVGVRAVLLRDEDEVLLVRHTYTDQWYLPGGGVKRGETITEALSRELNSELGLAKFDLEKILGIYTNLWEAKVDYIVVLVVRSTETMSQHDHEIEEVRYWRIDALPDATSPGTRRRLEELQRTRRVSDRW